MDSLALCELPHRAADIHADRLPRFKVHFYAAHGGVVEASVLPVSHIKIGAQQSVYVHQRIEVKRAGNTERVVIRSGEQA